MSITFGFLTVGAAAMTCLLALLPAVGHDQLWCLYVAGRMLSGIHLYGPQLFESNPPLVMWMLMLPAAIARGGSVPVTVVFKVLVVGLGAASGAACLALLRQLDPRLGAASRWAMAFAFVVVCGAMPARDFGQREHLLVLLCLPYLVSAAVWVEGRKNWRMQAAVRVAIGIAAGLGFSLKPHHLLVPTAVEGLLALRARSARSLLRGETLALLSTCLAYLAAIRLLTPEYMRHVVPVLRDTYWAIGDLSSGQLLLQAIELHLLAVAAFALWLARRGWAQWAGLQALTPVLLAAGTASTVAYYVQGTGWYYQQIPGLSFYAFALWVEIVDGAKNWAARRNAGRALWAWASTSSAGLALLAVTLTAYFSGYRLSRPLDFPSGLADVPDSSFFAGLPAGTPVAILTTEVDASVPPIATHHLLWAQRQNNLWTLPAILRNESPAAGRPPRRRIPAQRLQELDRLQHAWMVEDLDRWKPELVLVERCQDPAVHCQILEDRHDDLLAWFLRDPAFQAEFARYKYVRSAGPFDAYVLR